MSLFSSQTEKNSCGIVVDIGSGSVGIAIALTESITGELEILWSHREYMLIKDEASEHALLKEMHTTLVNAFLELGSNGLKAIRDLEEKVTPKYLQIAVSAPWVHTITKHIKFEDEKTFTVSTDVIKSLVETAQKDAAAEEQTKHSTFVQIMEATVHVALNGYLIKNPIGQKCQSINLAEITVLAEDSMIQTISELHSKIVPKTKTSLYSFMYIFYQSLRHLHPDSSEVCLVDITNEATEIGIVRDDILSYTTHCPFGLYSLAREIAKACEIPKEEAYNLLKNASADTTNLYGEKNKEKIEAIFSAYQEALATLFTQTGDTLGIPKTIFLHTSQNTEAFFSKHLKEAAKKATKSTHSIHLFTSEILDNTKMTELDDTALALSVHFFVSKDTYIGLEHATHNHNV